MKRIAFSGAVLLSSLMAFTTVTAAQPSPEEQAAANVDNRQAVFKLLAVANGTLGGMVRGAPYDADAAKLAVTRIETLAGMIPELFEADTRSFSNLDTRSATTIWDNKADFDKLAQDLVDGANAMMAVLESEAEPNLRAAFGPNIGTKCGACHDRFRID